MRDPDTAQRECARSSATCMSRFFYGIEHSYHGISFFLQTTFCPQYHRPRETHQSHPTTQATRGSIAPREMHTHVAHHILFCVFRHCLAPISDRSFDCQVLLLGAGESGKSTFGKQLRLLNGGMVTQRERSMYRSGGLLEGGFYQEHMNAERTWGSRDEFRKTKASGGEAPREDFWGGFTRTW